LVIVQLEVRLCNGLIKQHNEFMWDLNLVCEYKCSVDLYLNKIKVLEVIFIQRGIIQQNQ